MELPRRTVLGVALGAAAGGLGASSTAHAKEKAGGKRRVRPRERAVAFGFESLVAEPAEWPLAVERLRRADATALSLAVGRVDWTAFAWEAHPEAASSQVARTGRDYVQEALTALGGLLDSGVELTLTIDALAPALLAAVPGLAGVDPEGVASPEFASVSALAHGEVGDRIVQLAADVCARYRPDRIALTELMFDDSTFGDDDLESYRTATGRADWPRRVDGSIDTADESLGRWRSEALASLLRRVKEVAATRGAALDMDVRASWADPHGDRALSGHDYDILLTAADRITVWNYFGLSHRSAQYGAEITQSLQERHPGRFVMSTGLWAWEGIVSAGQLEESLAAVAGAGGDAVSVAPASMMTRAHWDALARVWKK